MAGRALFSGSRPADRRHRGRPARIADSGLVTLRPRIRSLVGQLATSSALVSVHVDGGDATYHSAVLSVDPAGRYLELDELTPESGHREVATGSLIEVEGRCAGAIVRFDTRVQAIGERSGIALYRTSLPREMVHDQKRGTFRARARVGKPVTVYLGEPERGLVTAQLSDISVGGLSVQIAPDQRVTFARGDRVPTSTVGLPKGKTMEGTLEIRHVRRGRIGSDDGWLVGGRFVDLDRKYRGPIQRFVTELDRELARRRARFGPPVDPDHPTKAAPTKFGGVRGTNTGRPTTPP